MRRATIALMSALALCAGCSSTRRPVDTYSLLVPSDAGWAARDNQGTAIIAVPESAALGIFAEPFIVERRGVRLVRELYRTWSPRPGMMLAVALTDAINATGSNVAQVGSPDDARWVVQTLIRDWSYQATPSGLVARIEVDLAVSDERQHATMLHTSFVAAKCADASSYDALIAAFDSSLKQVCAQCVAQIASAAK